jgi:hypothetical protein
MKTLSAAVLAIAGLSAVAPAYAQAPAAPAAMPMEVMCGGEDVDENDISTCEVDPILADAGNALGIVRNDNLIFSVVPRPVMTGMSGTFVDTEANPAGPAMEITRYEYAPDWQIPGLREDITLANGDRVIRVLRDGVAWNEGPRPGFNPMEVTDPNIVAQRQARLYLSPHGIIRAAAFATKGLCPHNDPADSNETFSCPENSVQITGPNTLTTTIDGLTYNVTLGEEEGIFGYVTQIEVSAGGLDIVRQFSNYHDGKGTGDDDTAAIALIGAATHEQIGAATTVVDEYRYGVYYPLHIVETVNGNTTLDVNITSGWTNRYVPFPTIEQLRSVAN